MPASMVSPPTEKRQEILLAIADWITKDSVVRKFYLIAHDILFMLDSCDPSEAVHIMPPDYQSLWVEPEIKWDLKDHETKQSIVEALWGGQEEQWKSLFELAGKSTVCKDVTQWFTTAHVVGQFNKNTVNTTREQQTFSMVARCCGRCWVSSWVVSFTAASQQAAISALHDLHTVFNDKKPKEALGTLSVEVGKAKAQGVAVSYRLMYAPLARAIADGSTFANTQARLDLVEAKLTADTVDKHPSSTLMTWTTWCTIDICAQWLSKWSASRTRPMIANPVPSGLFLRWRPKWMTPVARNSKTTSQPGISREGSATCLSRNNDQNGTLQVRAYAIDLIANDLQSNAKNETIGERLKAYQQPAHFGVWKGAQRCSMRAKVAEMRATKGGKGFFFPNWAA
jgi:hypothetical protein